MGLLGNLPTFGFGPTAIATGDFNGDGKPDLAVADFGDAVYILLGNGAGGFAAAAGSPFAVALVPLSIAVGRFDAGGTLDLAVVNNGNNTVSILLGDGAGAFVPAAPVSTDSGPLSVATADFNGDTVADLAVANELSDTVSIHLGDGAGGFTPAGSILVGAFPVWLATGDFDGDGRPDLAVLNQFDGTVSNLLGDGMGGFAPHPDGPFPVACGCATSLGIADLNGDGRLDLAVTNAPLDSVTILLGDGAGRFADAPGFPVPTGFESVAVVVADVNADGKPDLVTANSFSEDVSVILNLTCCYLTVSLAGAGGGSVTSSPASIACAAACLRAFDPGTTVTLTPTRVLGSSFAGWSGGGCTGRGPCVVPLMTDATVIATFEPLAAAGDFDGDLRADLAVFRPPTGEWLVFGSTGAFIGPVPFGAPGDRLVPADYDGDLRADLAVFRPATAEWFVFGSASGFSGPFPFGDPGDLPVPADYDSDGRVDLAVFRPSTGEWFVFGSATGSSGPVAFGAAGDLPVPADYDGDGQADLAVFRPSTAQWFVFGSATSFLTVAFGTVGDLAVPADYDGDGRTDLAVFRPSTAEWFRFGSATGFAGPIPFGAANLDRPAQR